MQATSSLQVARLFQVLDDGVVLDEVGIGVPLFRRSQDFPPLVLRQLNVSRLPLRHLVGADAAKTLALDAVGMLSASRAMVEKLRTAPERAGKERHAFVLSRVTEFFSPTIP